MKISQIEGSAVFTGRTTYYNKFLGQDDLKRNSFWHKNSSVDQTLGSYHTNCTGKVYFADPMEKVNDSIKDSVDYVVYDNEPTYPEIEDIRKNYLENNRTNYRDNFEEIRQYYYRREMGGFANVNDAKYQQWQAANCVGLYDKGGNLRFKKEKAEDEIAKLTSNRANMVKGIESTENELKSQKELKSKIDLQIENLEKMNKAYSDMMDFAKKNSSNEEELYLNSTSRVDENKGAKNILNTKYNRFENDTSTEKSILDLKNKSYKITKTEETLKNEHANLVRTLKQFKTIQADSERMIAEMSSYIKVLSLKVANADTQIASDKSVIEQCKVKLVPIFEELKKFYIKQGIKAVK